MLSRFIVEIHNNQYTSNMIYSWLGDLKKLQIDSSNINPIWEGKNCFTFHTNTIEPKEDCIFCKNDF